MRQQTARMKFSIYCSLRPFGRALTFAVKDHAPQTSRVMAQCAVAICPGCDLIGFGIDPLDARVVASFEAEHLAVAAVARDVPCLVSFRPLSIGVRDLLSRHQHGEMVLVPMDVAFVPRQKMTHLPAQVRGRL